MRIQTHVDLAIADGLDAEIIARNNVAGVLFRDEGEFIPFADLGYNDEFGYFRRSQFPDLPSDCTNEPLVTLHPLDAPGYQDHMAALFHDGHLFMLGSRREIVELAAILNHFLATGEHDPTPASEFDARWNPESALDIDAAVTYLTEHGYPAANALGALWSAVNEGRIPGAARDRDGDGWIFSRTGLYEWLKAQGYGDEAPKAQPQAQAAPEKFPMVLCDCGHWSRFPATTATGSACPDCYDRMDNP